MCDYPAPKQFAYIDPQDRFQRLPTPISSRREINAYTAMIPHKAIYESVYGWTGWRGGRIDADISKTAIIDGIFLDFDDADDPQKAIRDAAEVAWYVGHSTCNYSGKKGAHVMIHCYPVDLIPDLKGHVIRRFVNNLVDRLPELDTLDFAVVGDTSRVRRIIDSVHPGTKLHAIGLTAEELALLSIDEIRLIAQNRRGLIQVPEPSQWVSDELMRIEGEILHDRMNRLIDSKIISESLASEFIGDIYKGNHRKDVYRAVCLIGDELRKIKAKNNVDLRGSVIRGERLGATQEETWLLHAVRRFKATGRAATGDRRSEHKARVHLAKLADECGWTLSEICDIYTGADDYDPVITERMVRSCIGRR